MLLKAEHLQKSYRRTQVISDVSMEVAQGEVVGLLGPNGAGKTTCFYMMVGLVNADAGHVYLDDEDITDAPMHKRARKGLGYLPQDASIFRGLSVRDNIMAVLELRSELSQRQRQNELEQLQESLQVAHLSNQKGQSLSGGERRRVEIARALAAAPSFILLDEPFAGVDPISVGEIQRIVRQLKAQNIGILITDHNVRETLGICDRAYIISSGTVLSRGTPEEILADNAVRDVYLGRDFKL
jgi:lipopolysaccharide export system ATP-binding protein